MDISQLSESLQRDAVWIVFVNVLLQQAGLPVPAVPTLLLAGSLAASAGQLGGMLAAAIVASVLADWVWYLAGRAFGYRVLTTLCRMSINPASCVSQTEDRFGRWGLGSLVVAKFIPGFSTVAPPIAGSLRMALPGFLLAAAAGAALWAGMALAAGWILRDEVRAAINALETNAETAMTALAVAFAAWLGWKLWQKRRFRQLSALPHITPAELLAIRETQQPVLVLDLRGSRMIAETGPLAGATVAEHDHLLDAVGAWPKTQPIVTLCACPEDAGAVQAARQLLDAGYLSVRPLKGGHEAWLAAIPAEGTAGQQPVATQDRPAAGGAG
jgi:membrane protein DedA with SNARE-associated domain/rhodanese-related sulfurtransferase